MNVYLIRHGESFPTGSDNLRPLSDKGKEDIQNLADFLSPLNIKVGNIYHSEKLRAKQTAAIIETAITSYASMQTYIELDPLNSIIPTVDLIKSSEKDLMFVGHMPFMGKLCSYLTAGDESIDIVNFKTGSIVCLEKLEGLWSIKWMLTPELFNVRY